MFNCLKYSVTFPDTGRTLSANIQFDTGFCAITGSNESGKTMILEMLRFLLFGTAALRGVADDYKTLVASGSFSIKGEEYSVHRTMKVAALKRGDEIVASGITTVNEKIGQILGFGLPVFDVACSINQGEVERLGAMTAGERKRLIDGVLGIDSLEIVAKWGMDEARVLDKEAETIRRGLVAPVEPTPPEDYRPSDQIDLDMLRANARELASINGFLSHPRTAPLRPDKPCAQTVADLLPLAEEQRVRRSRMETLKARIAALPAVAPDLPADIDEQWALYDAYQETQQWLARNPVPTYTLKELQGWRADHDQADRWEERRLLAGREQQLRERVEAAATVSCPECGHDFHLHADTVAALEEELSQVEKALAAMGEVKYAARPRLRPQQIEDQIVLVEGYDYEQARRCKNTLAFPQPSIPRAHIPMLRTQIAQAAERERLQLELDLLSYDGSWEELLARRQAYEAAIADFDRQEEEYLAWAAERGAKVVRHSELLWADRDLEEGERMHRDAVAYEQAVQFFEAAVGLYDRRVAEADELELKAKQHRKVKELMTVLRSLIKQHLMPSLNRVSSHLLQQMTGGQRNSVYVDENFNVVVDNQRLETLSGSGKACTNLAIRIALGQVLTNKVFSVLLADEIDASMDDFRAENTSRVLDTLSNNIQQILLVSHKQVEASNVIQLGASLVTGDGAEGAV